MHIKSDRQAVPMPEGGDCGCRNPALGGELGGVRGMMMTEMKWPGWPELPFLLLFVGIAVLVAFLFLGAPGSRGDGEPQAESRASHAEGRASR